MALLHHALVPHEEVADDVRGEEEAVDGAAVLGAERLRRGGRLGGERAGEGEVDGPHPRGEGGLAHAGRVEERGGEGEQQESLHRDGSAVRGPEKKVQAKLSSILFRNGYRIVNGFAFTFLKSI